MLPRILSSVGFLGCLTLACATLGCAPAPLPDDLTDAEKAAVRSDKICELKATVTVRVDNQSSTAIRIAFASYSPSRPVQAFSRATYQVSRVNLKSSIRLQIAAGGLQVGTPPPVQTEPVICNDATLVIGGGVRYAFFYGDALRDLKPAEDGGN